MTRFDDSDLTNDAFLGGKLTLKQPRSGYRAGVDPVLLAASVPAQSGQSVLDLGCGAGAAILCLGARVAGLALAGVELQPAYADLARRNARAAALDLDVHEANITQLPEVLKQRRFDFVIANPPYYHAGDRSGSADTGREKAFTLDIELATWVDVAARRLAPKGYLHMINRVERLPELLAACQDRLGSIEVLPLAARGGRPPHLILLRARKSGRAAFKLWAPWIMHQGARHTADGDSYTPETTSILRDAAPLIWPKNAH